jgi:hypothetical protein
MRHQAATSKVDGVEDDQWLAHVLDACRRALARLREPGIEADAGLIADLERLEASLEERLAKT